MGIGIFPVVVQGNIVCGNGAIGEGVAARQALRGEIFEDRVRIALVALGMHEHVIVRVRSKTGKHTEGTRHRLGGPVALTRFGIAHRVARRTVKGAVPSDQRTGGGHLADRDVQRRGAERVGFESGLERPRTIVAASAVRTHIHVVLGVVQKIGERVGICVGRLRRAVVHIRAGGDGHHFPGGFRTRRRPGDITTRCGVVAERDMLRSWTAGNQVDCQIIHVRIAVRGGVMVLERNILS